MSKIRDWVVFFLLFGACCSAKELDYSACHSFVDVISLETEEIVNTASVDYKVFANLYATRGESYLLTKDHQAACDDFEKAFSYLDKFQNSSATMGIAFRTTFGLAIAYDNLGKDEASQQAITALNEIVNSWPSCEHVPSDFIRCSDYDDVIGPEYVEPSDCIDFVVATAKDMEGMIQSSVKNLRNGNRLFEVIKQLKNKAIECCRARKYWKSCLAPIVRKRRQWKDDNKRYDYIPDEHILYY